MTNLDAFILGLPKAELHLHIEGSLEPEQLFTFAKRNGLQIPYASITDVQAAYDFGNLQDFLDIYYAYFDRAAADGVVHCEIMFDPQTHMMRGIPFAVVIEGLLSAMEEAQVRHGISAYLIVCFLRHLSEEEAFEVLAAATPWLDRIAAVGLDSSEVGHPPEKFARVFAAAADHGLRRVAHAGEEGPPDYVRQALDMLRVDRIDHGNRSMEDSTLVDRLVQERMPLTVCPLSNLKLRVVDDMADHPVREMLELGLHATINSDDPAYFGGYLADNYRAVARALPLNERQLATLARNSFTGSFLPQDRINLHLAQIDDFLVAHGSG